MKKHFIIKPRNIKTQIYFQIHSAGEQREKIRNEEQNSVVCLDFIPQGFVAEMMPKSYPARVCIRVSKYLVLTLGQK